MRDAKENVAGIRAFQETAPLHEKHLLKPSVFALVLILDQVKLFTGTYLAQQQVLLSQLAKSEEPFTVE